MKAAESMDMFDEIERSDMEFELMPVEFSNSEIDASEVDFSNEEVLEYAIETYKEMATL